MGCTNVAFHDGGFSVDVPTAGVHWSGTLAADGKSLAGSVTAKLLTKSGAQNIVTPLTFARQSTLAAEKARSAPAYDAALPPVSAADLQSVLDRDLAGALKSGELAPATGTGVSIAVFAHGLRRVFSYGTAKPDSIYEIGSITKTFTGLLLSQMAAQGRVRLNEPVRELLPPGTVARPQGAEITLLDLATQRSGLPPMPDNISLANIDNPYADYHAADLLAYIGKHGVANPTAASSPFGSLGFGLLGVALANRAGTSYADLLKEEITGPLGMKDTVLTLSPEQQLRFLPGHDQFHGPAKAWDADALAGAISLRSTAADLLVYLEASLHPENLKPAAGSAGAATLAAALRQSLQPQTEVAPEMQIALGWLYQRDTGNYWHNGATAAYSSYAFFNPKGDYAAVVLLNGSPGVNGSFVEVLGRHISQRLAGKPAISLVY
jgi:CubicO group peptidase (beta-lactamase class C family)